MEHTTGTVTVQAMSSQPHAGYKNPNDVDFAVKYPEGYAGPKLMPEGVVTVSKEGAEQFAALGIGKVVEAGGPVAETSEAEATVTPKKKGK